MKKIRILLADDHRIVREGLRLLILAQPDMIVVGEADHGGDALRLAAELQPDVIVMDLTMPKVNGMQATQQLKLSQQQIKIVALTVHEDEAYLRQVCQAGAHGYVLKTSAADELVHAIRTVMAEGNYYDPILAGKLIASQMHEDAGKPEPAAAELSAREREVLVLCAWGLSNKEIAAKLEISVKTVETYRARVGEKLHLRSRTEMVRYALNQGWLKEGGAASVPSAG